MMTLGGLFGGAAWAENGEAEGSFPALNDAGFLDSGEFLFEDPDNGIWRYAGSSLRVEIFRREQKKPARVWYEAEVWCAEGSEMPHMIAENPDSWMKDTEYPHKIARKTGTVLAVSSDYSFLRTRQKKRVGIILRNGKILSEKTYPKNSSNFPNLDCMALYADGTMKVWFTDTTAAPVGDPAFTVTKNNISFGIDGVKIKSHNADASVAKNFRMYMKDEDRISIVSSTDDGYKGYSYTMKLTDIGI